MSSLSTKEFLEKNWHTINEHDIQLFNSSLPPPSPSVASPTTDTNTNPLASRVELAHSASPPINLPNCQENILYQMQDISNTLPASSSSTSMLLSNQLYKTSRQLSLSSDQLSIDAVHNRAKHHLIDWNSNVTDNNANVQHDLRKEQVLQLFKLTSPTSTVIPTANGSAFNVGRSQSLTTSVLPMANEFNFRYNPLYSNIPTNNNGTISAQNDTNYMNHFYSNVLSTQQQIVQQYPMSPSGTFSPVSIVSPTIQSPQFTNGFNYYQSSQNYVNLNQQLINQINNNSRQNNNSEQSTSGTKLLEKSTDLLRPTSVFVAPKQSSKQIIDLFDPLLQNNNTCEITEKEILDGSLIPPAYVNVEHTYDRIDSPEKKNFNDDDIKNNNDNQSCPDQRELNKIFDCFQVSERKCIAPDLTDYCDHLKALYLSFFSKSNCLINSGLVFSPRIEVNPNKQNLDHQQMNQFYFFSSNNHESLNDIQYITTEISDAAEEEMVDNIVIFDVRFHLLVYSKLTGCEKPELTESSSVKSLDSNHSWFSIKFSSNIEKTVDMIIFHVVYNVADSGQKADDGSNSTRINTEDYLLKVNGFNEFLLPKSLLSSYVYVQKCKKSNRDVVLELIDQTSPDFWRPFLRSNDDTNYIMDHACPEQILPKDTIDKFVSNNVDQLNRLIDEFNLAYTTFLSAFSDIGNFKKQKNLFTDIIDRIQQLCLFLSRIETSSLTSSIEKLKTWYKSVEFIFDEKNLNIEKLTLKFNSAMAMIVKEFIRLIELYSKVFPVNFELRRKLTDSTKKSKRKIEITKNVGLFTITVDVCAQMNNEWRTDFTSFALFVTIFHGFNILDFRTTNRAQMLDFRRVVFAQQLKFKYLTSTLPRETRIEFVLVGFRTNNTGKQEVDAIASTYFYLYDQEHLLRSGSHLLPFTLFDPFYSFTFNSQYLNRENVPPVIFDNSFLSSYNMDPSAVMLVMALTDIPDDVDYYFPEINQKTSNRKSFTLDTVVPLTPSVRYNTSNIIDDSFYGFHGQNTDQLSQQYRSAIIKIIQRNPLETIDQSERDLIWENREILANYPGAILKILKAPPTWSHHDLPIIYHLLERFEYTPSLANSDLMKMPFCTPIETLQLLSSDYPDQNVRRLAIRWLKTISIDELCDYLPQLVQALRYETSIDSHLIWLLFEFSLISSRFCHYFYWQLKSCITDSVFGFRCRVYLNSLFILCGERARKQFLVQEHVCTQLTSVCVAIKENKDSRNLLLRSRLEEIHKFLNSNPISIPLSPSLYVSGLDINKCSYFNSNSLPLKIVFNGAPPYLISDEKNFGTFISHISKSKQSLSTIYEKKNWFHKIIFKCGDDLRQDMLVMQIISIINRIWLRAGLDMRLIIFGVLNNSNRTGMIEMVSRASTLREIQQEYSVIGTFKNRTIENWLKRHNPSQFDYQMAVENFVHSCAGYVVITYLLGICDRHNDNIMVTSTGNLFHIDFGKFLGDAQMMAGFRRDRAPFVFTAEMAYVINDGDKPTKNYQYFVELCCNCFTLVRQNGNFLLSLLSMMIPSGIFGLSPETIKYFHNALMPNLTDSQAKGEFNRLIEKALGSVATQINFLFHTLAQLRFNNSSNANTSQDDHYSHLAPIPIENIPGESIDGTEVSLGDDLNSLEPEDSCIFSFLKKRFTQATDGYITNLEVVSVMKHMENFEKVYFFQIKVDRKQLPESFVYRSYREFIELYEKLSKTYSLAKFHRLSRSPILARSNRREIAQQRCMEIRLFLNSLKQLAQEISHSDIVYTFFHSIHRDYEFSNLKNDTKSLVRQHVQKIKLNICYRDNGLNVLICHVRNLVSERTSSPDTYVKLYLKPDPAKSTKRKTRVISRNSHPTFMENIFYPYKLEDLKYKVLDISVWEYDRVTGNSCLGRTEQELIDLDLSTKTEKWLQLKSCNQNSQSH